MAKNWSTDSGVTFLSTRPVVQMKQNILGFLVAREKINSPDNLRGYVFVIHCFS